MNGVYFNSADFVKGNIISCINLNKLIDTSRSIITLKIDHLPDYANKVFGVKFLNHLYLYAGEGYYTKAIYNKKGELTFERKISQDGKNGIMAAGYQSGAIGGLITFGVLALLKSDNSDYYQATFVPETGAFVRYKKEKKTK